MPIRHSLYILLLMALCLFVPAFAALGQQDSITEKLMLGNIYKILREDSIPSPNMQKSSVSGFREEDIRDTPGAVTVITSDQIRAMGATDLMEILNAIPGISIGRDVDDVQGISMRGLWAHEGKFMLMVNGIPLNDLDFGICALGGRYPIGNISRIEIMNGPGSVIYGGVAALGVINVILRTPQESPGTKITSESSVSNKLVNATSAGIVSNYLIGKDTYLTMQANVKSSLRSTWTDYRSDGSPISYGDSTKMNSQNIFLGIIKKDFSSQLFLNNYTYDVSESDYNILMFSLAWDNQYKMQVKNNSQLHFRTLYQYQLPWLNLNTNDPEIISTNTVSQRMRFIVNHDWKINSKFTFTNGLQASVTQGRILSRSHVYNINNENILFVCNVAAHSELKYAGSAGIFRVGGRIERNTFTSILFAPRLSWNKSYRKWVFKSLINSGVKIPTIQNVNLGPQDTELKHETVNNAEVAVGYEPTKNIFTELVMYKTTITNPIFYVVDSIFTDNYMNRYRAGTEGIEWRFTYKNEILQVMAGWCFYQVARGMDAPEIETSGIHPRSYLGAANHRASFNGTIKLNNSFSFYSSCILQGKSYSYEPVVESPDVFELKSNPVVSLLNAGVIIHPKKLESLRICTQVNNILDSRFVLSSPLNNDVSSMPMFARQITLNLQWRLNS